MGKKAGFTSFSRVFRFFGQELGKRYAFMIAIFLEFPHMDCFSIRGFKNNRDMTLILRIKYRVPVI